MNMGAYIEGLRMEKAKELLQSTQWPVTEVATPRQFREQEKEIT